MHSRPLWVFVILCRFSQGAVGGRGALAGGWGEGGADPFPSTPLQVVLCNPVCGVAYALTVWRFFRDRTEEEEISLIHFFGDEYLEYKKRVPTGLPFIQGVKVGL